MRTRTGVFSITFQSALPLRGATLQSKFGDFYVAKISIRAPLAGSDMQGVETERKAQ